MDRLSIPLLGDNMSYAELIGRIFGILISSIIIGSILAFIYAKVRKRQFNWKVALIIGVITLVLSLAGQIGKQKESDHLKNNVAVLRIS